MKTNMLIWATLVALTFGCADDNKPSPCSLDLDREDLHFYEFAHEKGNFIAWTSNPEVIKQVLVQLALPEEFRGMHINGRIDRLPEGCDANKDWSWYFVPDEWALTEISIELCDGSPLYVEENLDEYIRIQAYCPWGSRVLREVARP